MICYALSYQLDPLVLELNFVADNIKLIFSMSNVNIIVDTKLQPNNKLYIVQIKQKGFTSNERTDQRNKPI